MSRIFSEFSWLCQYSRPIAVAGRNVQVLYTPDQYYETLKHGVQTAKNRVIFSTLYLGIGTRETELVSTIKESLSDDSRPDLQCTILLDYLRGSRFYPNSKTMVRDLVCNFGERFKLHMYHTPNLRGFLKHIGPERFNEVMGLQHMKIYICDNDLVISGANLSRDYFTDRQDRYLKFNNCPEIADYFAALVNTVISYSFKLRPDGGTEKPPMVAFDPSSSNWRNTRHFRASLGDAVRKLTMPQGSHNFEANENFEVNRSSSIHSHEANGDSGSDLDTVVYPLVQMGYYGIRQEEVVTEKVLKAPKSGEQLYLASGYFNLPPQYIEAILEGKGECKVLAASPQANGFYKAKGVAKHVPYMYIHFAKKFLEALSRHGCDDRMQYWEFYRKGWTFHGKGLWYYLSGEKLPSLTLVGSSNYGHRSLTRDLEAQVAVVTRNERLREALHEEQQRMFSYGREWSLAEAKKAPERQLNFLQWLATQFLKPHV